jgi:hypothetical protein
MTTVTPETLEERVRRLRTQLQSSSEGRKVMIELAPSSMVSTKQNSVDFTSRNIVDFTDWSEWSQWGQSY